MYAKCSTQLLYVCYHENFTSIVCGLPILKTITSSKITKYFFGTNFEVLFRLVLVSGLKWVDEVIANAPYAITEQFMNRLFNEHKIDYIIHGDDPCLLPDGTDAYALAKRAGRYKQIKRTEGVSSTDIVGTIILLISLRTMIFIIH